MITAQLRHLTFNVIVFFFLVCLKLAADSWSARWMTHSTNRVQLNSITFWIEIWKTTDWIKLLFSASCSCLLIVFTAFVWTDPSLAFFAVACTISFVLAVLKQILPRYS